MAFQARMLLAIMVASAGLSDAAWQKDANGKPLGCAHSVTVLRDMNTDGWPAKCQGLAEATTQDVTAAGCAQECTNNAQCSAWQLTPDNKCWVSIPGSRGVHCVGGEGRPSNMSAGQRVQHGTITVLRSLKGWWLSGLKPLGVLDSSSAETNRNRCRDQCYSDINCRYWLYGGTTVHAGCWIEAPDTYKAQLNTLTNSTSDAQTVGYGEYIEHSCPPPPVPAAPAKKSSNLGLILGIIGAVVLALILLAVIYFVFCHSTPPKAKKTRAIKIQQKKPAEAQAGPVVMSPMPLLAPTYTTYAAPAPTYQVVAQAPPMVSTIVAPSPVASVQYAAVPQVMSQAPVQSVYMPAPVAGGAVFVG